MWSGQYWCGYQGRGGSAGCQQLRFLHWAVPFPLQATFDSRTSQLHSCGILHWLLFLQEYDSGHDRVLVCGLQSILWICEFPLSASLVTPDAILHGRGPFPGSSGVPFSGTLCDPLSARFSLFFSSTSACEFSHPFGVAQVLHEAWHTSLFNVVFTSFPVLIMAIFDTDMRHKEDIYSHPDLYRAGQENRYVCCLVWMGATPLQCFADGCCVSTSPTSVQS